MRRLREWAIEKFEIPQRTVLNRKVPKKTFFSQGDLSKKEKELFTSQIEGIYLLSVMNRQSMNISPYQSEEHHGLNMWYCSKDHGACGRTSADHPGTFPSRIHSGEETGFDADSK